MTDQNLVNDAISFARKIVKTFSFPIKVKVEPAGAAQILICVNGVYYPLTPIFKLQHKSPKLKDVGSVVAVRDGDLFVAYNYDGILRYSTPMGGSNAEYNACLRGKQHIFISAVFTALSQFAPAVQTHYAIKHDTYHLVVEATRKWSVTLPLVDAECNVLLRPYMWRALTTFIKESLFWDKL